MVDRGDRGDRALERAGHGRAGVLVYTVNTPPQLKHPGGGCINWNENLGTPWSGDPW